MDAKSFILTNQVVAISRKVYRDDLLKAAACLKEAGIKIMEITFDQSSPTCLKDTADSIAALKDAFKDEMCFGAGTVMTRQQVQAAASAGADFALAPNTDPEIIRAMKDAGLVAVPGALTPSEIATAYNCGGDIVKLFPASTLGFDYVKAFRAPISHVPLMAVGGVSPENICSFLQAGFCSVGIGSNIINEKRAVSGAFDEIKQAAQLCMNNVRAMQQKQQ